MSTKAIALEVRKRGKLIGETRPPHGVQSRSERDEDRSAGGAQDVRDLFRFEDRIDGERCAGRPPPQMAKWVSGRLGRT